MITNENIHILAAKAVEKRPRWLFLFLQTLGLLLSCFVLMNITSLVAIPIGQRVWGLIDNPLLLSAIGASIFGLVVSTSPMIIAVAIWVKLVEKRSAASIGFVGNSKMYRYLRGFFWGMLCMAVAAVLILCIGGGKIDDTYLPSSGVAALPYILIMLFGWLVQGASEEVIIQGWLMPKAVKTYGLWVGVAISSSVFAALHLGNSGVSPLAIINLALYGIFSATYALYEESIWGVCAFHSAWNFSQGNIFGFLVSGGTVRGGSLIGIISEHSNLLNGGAFGPEGGLIVTLVLTIGICVLVSLHRKKSTLVNNPDSSITI